MELIKIPLKGLYRKLGIFCTLLSYFDKTKRMKDILKLLCRDSHLFLKQNEELLSKLIIYYFKSDDDMIVQNINEKFNGSYIKDNMLNNKEIILNFINNKQESIKLISFLKDYYLFHLKLLKIQNLSAMPDESLKDLSTLCHNSLPYYISNLALTGCYDTNIFLPVLSVVLRKATDSINISKNLNHLLFTIIILIF